MTNLTNILPDEPGNDDLNEDELLQYLEGKLSPEEQHAFEKKMADSAFVNDAVEGLSAFSSKDHLNEYVQQLNKNLQQQLQAKKQKKEKRKIKDINWQVVYVVIILLLCLLGYTVIRLLKK